jgi:recombination protein RecT
MKTDGSDRAQKGSAGKTESQERQDTLVNKIARMSREFERALPKTITVDRMMRIVMTAIRSTPQLAYCVPESFYGALLTSLQLGLEVNTPLGQAYLIPRYKGKGEKRILQCHFELGYQGIVELCYRTGLYKRICADVVYKGDNFKYKYGTTAFLDHIPCGEQETPEYAWALYELINGGGDFKVWTWNQAMKHGETFSESFDYNNTWKSPWLSNPTSQKGMVKKSVLRDALSYAPRSVENRELSNALALDGNAIIAKPGEEYDPDGFSWEISKEEEPQQERHEKGKEGDNRENKQEQIPPPDESLRPPPQRPPERKPDPVPASRSNNTSGKRTNGLFPQDEDQALEEQYERQMAGVEPPDFGG